MTLSESRVDPASTLPKMQADMMNLAKKRMDVFIEVQKDFMQTIEDINHDIFNRAKAEAALASEFVGKLSSAKSVPDATTTYQEWASREMELLAEDGRAMFANGERLIQASRRLFANGQ
jgi:hypothetical protein